MTICFPTNNLVKKKLPAFFRLCRFVIFDDEKGLVSSKMATGMRAKIFLFFFAEGRYTYKERGGACPPSANQTAATGRKTGMFKHMSQTVTQSTASQVQNVTVNTAQDAPVQEARRDLPRELQNARVSNTQRASTGFSVRSIFTAIGRFFGIVRTAEPPQPRVPAPAQGGNQAPAQPAPSEQEEAAQLIRKGDYMELPNCVIAAGNQALDELREMFGADVIPIEMDFTKLTSGKRIADKLSRLPAGEWKGALKGIIKEDAMEKARKLAVRVAAESFVREHGLSLKEMDIDNLASRLRNAGPVAQGLNGCNDPESVRKLVKGALVQELPKLATLSEANRCTAHGKEWASELLAGKTGFSAGNMLDSVNFDSLVSKLNDLKNAINKGKVGNEPGFNVEQAFRKVIADFVDGRVKLAEKVDGLDISPELKTRWKSEFLMKGLPKGVEPEDLVLIARESQAADALKKTLDAGKTGQELVNGVFIMGKLVLVKMTAHLGALVMRKLDANERQQISFLASEAVLDANPEHAEKLFGQDIQDLLIKKNDPYATDFYYAAAAVSSKSGVSHVNGEFAEAIEKRGFVKLPIHLNQGIHEGVALLRTAFGDDALPAEMKDILNMELPGGKTVRKALGERMRAHDEHLTNDDLNRFIWDVLTPVVREKALAQEAEAAAESLGIQLSDLDRKRILDQLLPQAGEAKSRDAAARAIKESLGNVILSTHFARTFWNDVKADVSSQLAKAYGLTESRVQTGLSELPDLYDEFMALSAEKREALMNGDAFSNWCEERLEARMGAIGSALAAIRDAGLPDAATNVLIDRVLSGKVDALNVPMVLQAARNVAGHLDAAKLMAAFQGNNYRPADFAAALNGFERQLWEGLPSKGFDEDTLAMMRDMARQMFMEQHRALAVLMARIPAAEVARLSGRHPASDLSLLHVGRGLIADEWLQPKDADAISGGTASANLQEKLENALRHGEEIYQGLAPNLPEHLRPFLRHFVGGLDLGSPQQREQALLVAARMAGAMQQWEDFSFEQCPEALADHIGDWQQNMAAGETANDETMTRDVHKVVYKDAPRSLFSLGGRGYLKRQPPEAVAAEFKDLVTPNHAQKDLSDAQKAHNAKVQRFVSSLMTQGNWVPLLDISYDSAPPQVKGQDGVGKFVRRPWGGESSFAFPLLGPGGSGENHVEVEVSKDGKTAVVRQSKTFALASGTGNRRDSFGNVRISYEMTVSLEGEPRVTGARVSQKLISSLREIE